MALTREVAAKQLRRYMRAMAYRHLKHFVRQAWPVVEPGVNPAWNWHLDAICDHIQWFLEGWLIATGRGHLVHPDSPAWKVQGDERSRTVVQNLFVNAAPATLKSKIAMVFAPGWMWLRVPSWTVACVSGNPANVTRDSIQGRDLVTSPWYRSTFDVTWVIRSDVDAKEKWQTTAGGERVSKGLQSTPVGLHVDAIFLDDPDDMHKVYSEAERKATKGHWDAYGNRVNSLAHSLRMIIQQRMHVDDLTGQVQTTGDWAKLEIPVAFDPRFRSTTPWGWTDPRSVANENMHPERFTPEALAKEKRRLGPVMYEAQYNQRPESIEGGMFKREWIRFWRPSGAQGERAMLERPPGCRSREEVPAVALPAKANWMALTVDGTFGSESAAASRVGLLCVLGRGGDRFVLADRTRKMSGVNEMVQEIVKLVNQFKGVKVVVVEKKALGAAVVEALQKLIRDSKLRQVAVIEIDPKGDSKESRASAMQPDIFAGNLYVEDGAEWLVSGQGDDDNGFVGELCAFPGGRHDDRVDALSQLWRHYAVHASMGRTADMLNAIGKAG